jgi:hypothetical protein
MGKGGYQGEYGREMRRCEGGGQDNRKMMWPSSSLTLTLTLAGPGARVGSEGVWVRVIIT